MQQPETIENQPLQPTLSTERLTLEPIVDSHAEELCELFNDPELHRFVPFTIPTLEEQRARCIRWSRRKSPDGSELWLNWAARCKVSGIIAAHFQAGVKGDGVASVGYVVARAFQNQGLATEGMRAVLDFLHQDLKVIEVKAWTDTRNLATHRLAEKLGMVKVEMIQDADFFKGSSSDEFVFSKVF